MAFEIITDHYTGPTDKKGNPSGDGRWWYSARVPSRGPEGVLWVSRDFSCRGPYRFALAEIKRVLRRDYKMQDGTIRVMWVEFP